MPHRYFTTEISNGTATLRGADAHHLSRVMRGNVAFLGIWFFSATDNSAEGARERELFRAQFIRSQTGFGVEQGRAH